jgi:polyhydroxybutyrate depolymerase
MHTSARYFATLALLAVFACEDDPEALVDGGSQVIGPDAAPPAAPEAGLTPDAAAPALDAAAPAPDAAPSPTSDAASSPPADAAAPQVDAALDAGAPSTDAGPKTCVGSPPLAPGATTRTVTVGGQQRSFALRVPRSYTGATGVPLVLDFHGLHLTSDLYGLFFSEWDAHADQEGYLLATPQGIDNAWNVGPCCTESRTVDDVAFARAIVDDLRAAACVDERRVYATGYSNGGGVSYKLACDAADVFAAIAPAAFDLLEEMDCRPSRPLSVFIFRGTNDDIVPYAGGPSTPPTLYTLPEIHFLGANKTFERWGQLNGCTDSPADTGAGCKTYAACRAGVKVTLCTIQGGGHDPLPFDAAWPMLKAFSKP